MGDDKYIVKYERGNSGDDGEVIIDFTVTWNYMNSFYYYRSKDSGRQIATPALRENGEFIK